MSIEDLIRTLKVYKQEIQQDEGFKKEKSLALITQKVKASSTCKESSSRPTSKSSSKGINTGTSYDDESNDESLREFILCNTQNTCETLELYCKSKDCASSGLENPCKSEVIKNTCYNQI